MPAFEPVGWKPPRASGLAARDHDGRLFIGTLSEPTLAVHEL